MPLKLPLKQMQLVSMMIKGVGPYHKMKKGGHCRSLFFRWPHLCPLGHWFQLLAIYRSLAITLHYRRSVDETCCSPGLQWRNSTWTCGQERVLLMSENTAKSQGKPQHTRGTGSARDHRPFWPRWMCRGGSPQRLIQSSCKGGMLVLSFF